MKRIVLFAAILAVATAVISCSKDDAPAPAAPAAAAPTPTPCSLGYMYTCPSSPCYSPSNFHAFPVTVGASAVTVNSLTLCIGAGVATDSLRMALYSNHSINQAPSALLAQSGVVAADVSNDQAVSIPPRVLTAGEIYWVAYQVSPDCLNVCQVATSRRFYGSCAWGGFPAAAPSGSIVAGQQPVGFIDVCP